MAVEEKRLYPRLTLKIEDGCFGHFKLVNGESLSVPIINLSAGGINVIVPQKSASKIKQGDLLMLKNIAGAANLHFVNDLKADIRWIKPLERTDYLSVGCRFKELSDPVRKQLSRFVDSERMARGQYT